MKSKVLAILCCAAMLVCMFAMPVFAETVTANGAYKEKDGRVKD